MGCASGSPPRRTGPPGSGAPRPSRGLASATRLGVAVPSRTPWRTSSSSTTAIRRASCAGGIPAPASCSRTPDVCRAPPGATTSPTAVAGSRWTRDHCRRTWFDGCFRPARWRPRWGGRRIRGALPGCTSGRWSIARRRCGMAYPLRLSPAETDEVVDAHQIRCTHYDAFPVLSPRRRPRETLQPNRDSQSSARAARVSARRDGRLQMVFKLGATGVPGELTLDAFDLARGSARSTCAPRPTTPGATSGTSRSRSRLPRARRPMSSAQRAQRRAEQCTAPAPARGPGHRCPPCRYGSGGRLRQQVVVHEVHWAP